MESEINSNCDDYNDNDNITMMIIRIVLNLAGGNNLFTREVLETGSNFRRTSVILRDF